MATVFGAYMSPLQRELEIISLQGNAELKRLETMEMIYESKLEADYLTAEAMVLENGGTEEDLCQYYIEAQNNNKGNGGIISTIVGWIGKQLERFGSWINDITAGNHINNLNGSINGDKETVGMVNTIINGFNKVKERLKGALQTILGTGNANENDKGLINPMAIVTTLGLAAGGDFFLKLAKNGFNDFKAKKEGKNKGDTTLTKDDYNSFRKSWNGLMKDVKDICKLAKDIMKTFPGGEKAAEIIDTANQARKDAKAARLQKFKDAKNAEKNAQPTGESVEDEQFDEAVLDPNRNYQAGVQAQANREQAELDAKAKKLKAEADKKAKEAADAEAAKKAAEAKAKEEADAKALRERQAKDMVAQGEQEKAEAESRTAEQAAVQQKQVQQKAADAKTPETAQAEAEPNGDNPDNTQAAADGSGNTKEPGRLKKLAAGAEGVIHGIIKFVQLIVQWGLEGLKYIFSWLPGVGGNKKDTNVGDNNQGNQQQNGNNQNANAGANGGNNQNGNAGNGQNGNAGDIPVQNANQPVQTKYDQVGESTRPERSFFNLEDEDYAMITESMSQDDAISELDTLFEDF